MVPSPEAKPVAQPSRKLWFTAIVAVIVLVLIAALALAAFVSLDLLRPLTHQFNSSATNPPNVAPEPTMLHPWMHAPPSTWDDGLG